MALADVLRADDPQLAQAIGAIGAEVDERGLGGPLYAEAVARQLVVLLLRRYAALRFRLRDEEGMLTAGQRRTVLEFIDAHLEQVLHLDVIAATVNLGACTFARQFRKTMGATPHAYVVERRLDRARRLLVDTRLPAKQIAAACGFADQAHMTRLFGRRFGVTPSVFRRAAPGVAAPD